MKRLKKRSDFQRITKQGQAIKLPAFVFLYTDQGTAASTRIGFTATKRTVGNAVHRNRAKRRLRAIADATMRLNSNFCLPQGVTAFDGVFIARHKILNYPFEKAVKEFADALMKEGFSTCPELSTQK